MAAAVASIFSFFPVLFFFFCIVCCSDEPASVDRRFLRSFRFRCRFYEQAHFQNLWCVREGGRLRLCTRVREEAGRKRRKRTQLNSFFVFSWFLFPLAPCSSSTVNQQYKSKGWVLFLSFLQYVLILACGWVYYHVAGEKNVPALCILLPPMVYFLIGLFSQWVKVRNHTSTLQSRACSSAYANSRLLFADNMFAFFGFLFLLFSLLFLYVLLSRFSRMISESSCLLPTVPLPCLPGARRYAGVGFRVMIGSW